MIGNKFVNSGTSLSFHSATDVMMGRNPESCDYSQQLSSLEAVSDPLFKELLLTRAFRRLANIRFLGGIDYFLVRYPNGVPGNRRYTRYEHSLGVAKLAMLYANMKGLCRKKGRLAWAAALLHDIGHAPLSHTLETAFKSSFGIDHHMAGEEILLGRSPYGREITDILESHGLDPEEVHAIAAGQTDDFDGFFNGPINFDTIEGILRSWSYVRPRANTLRPETVVFASMNRLTEADMHIVDEFWAYKDYAYRYIVRSEFGVFSDYLCESLVLNNIHNLERNDYFLTEQQMFKKIPKLKGLLRESELNRRGSYDTPDEISYKERRFSVDARFDFYGRDDNSRYTQQKEDKVMKAPDPVTADDMPYPSLLDRIHDLDLRKNYRSF